MISVSFFFCAGAQSATTKFIATTELTEMICFDTDFAIFCVYSIQICFESQHSKNLVFMDSNNEVPYFLDCKAHLKYFIFLKN